MRESVALKNDSHARKKKQENNAKGREAQERKKKGEKNRRKADARRASEGKGTAEATFGEPRSARIHDPEHDRARGNDDPLVACSRATLGATLDAPARLGKGGKKEERFPGSP